MYTHLIFDIDGTMLDAIDADVLSLQEVIQSCTGTLYPFEKLHAAMDGLSRPILMEIT